MRFRLRVQDQDYHLTDGQYALGRNASCQIILDDALVSRRHALMTVDGDEIFVEDLQSRNGVLVNGMRIPEPTSLNLGDVITIGSHELHLLQGYETVERMPRAAPANKATVPRMAQPTYPDPTADYVGGGIGADIVDLEASVARRADQFRMIGGVADKALALGRAAEAERLLASALADVIEASRAGRALPPSLVDEAARYSARLATATGKGGWADYVIELYAAQQRPPPAVVIDELYNGMRRVSSVDVAQLRAFIEQLRLLLPSFGPAERFLFQRLEGLERLAALR